jgi:hypothetical protein
LQRAFHVLPLALAAACAAPDAPPAPPGAGEVRVLARDAYVWGFPLVDSYRIQHAYCVDRGNPEYKAPWNVLHHIARVYTPEDKAVQTPNSDTPYSMIGLDLRREPIVLTLPAVEAGRYVSVQLVDLYTFNFEYLGTRTTGNGGGNFLVAGPGWQGETPAGIARVLRSETELALGICRTQLLSPEDLKNVEFVQAGYAARPLSEFLGQPPPPDVPPLEFPAPLSPEEQESSPRFFELLDFVLRRCPVHPQDAGLRARLAALGVGVGEPLRVDAWTHERRAAVAQGIADAWVEMAGVMQRVAKGELSSGDLFGTRERLDGRWPLRMAGAVLGIFGNSREEALYPSYRVDADGEPLDGAHRYTLRFAPGALPPVKAFWSLTMYELPASLLYANALERYLINSPMLPGLKLDADGGLTLHVQHESPGPERESNWLPAPPGPFACALRLYLPGPEALDGRWQAPPMVHAQ